MLLSVGIVWTPIKFTHTGGAISFALAVVAPPSLSVIVAFLVAPFVVGVVKGLPVLLAGAVSVDILVASAVVVLVPTVGIPASRAASIPPRLVRRLAGRMG